MHKPYFLAASLLLLAIAFGQTVTRLMINGQSVEGAAIVVKGQTYIPLKALQAAGVKSATSGDTLKLTFPTGGSVQVAAQEGGINDWLFNGVWRFRVLSVAPATERSGWIVRVELRNGTKTDQLALSGTGYDSLKLVLSDGTMLDCANSVDITSKGFAQASGETFNLTFNLDEIGDKKPDKLLLFIKPDADLRKYMREALKANYTGSDPSFRVKL